MGRCRGGDRGRRRVAVGPGPATRYNRPVRGQRPRMHDYHGAFTADGTRVVRKATIPEVPAERGVVVEDPASGFCGAVVRVDVREVTLEDRHGRHRVFPLRPAGFLVDGRPATLVPPPPASARPGT